jgi:conjugative transfer signal peptidase TraF
LIKLTLICRCLVVVGVSFLALGMICFAAGGRVNSTRSIPIGLYWLTDAPVKKDVYVIFCPPVSPLFDEARDRGYISAGFCSGGYGFMMKQVLATGNDRIDITGEGVKVNGQLLAASKAMKADKAGRLMPSYSASNYTLRNTEILLMSDGSGTSFDGRYFGPIQVSQIRGVIRPVLTW